jgi:hypothetical protein
MKFLFKYKIIFASVAYLGVIWASFFFIISPLIGRVISEANKTQEDILDRESEKKRMEDLPKLKGQYEMVTSEENKIKISLTKDKAINLIKSLETLADKTGNKISIAIDEKTPVVVGKNSTDKNAKKTNIVDDLPKLNYLKLKITLVGNYNDMVNFMTKLENLDYYSDVISISISQGEPLENSSERDLFGKLNPQSAEKVKSNLLKSELAVLFYLE